jgi:Domain of unknown function (DUF4411)
VAYCLDANTFIEAKNRYYGFDFCPAYWVWLDQEAASGKLLCVRAIYDEIAEGKDDLATWIKARSDGRWFCKIDAEDTQRAFKQVVAHVESRRRHYTDDAIARFMGRGDPWLLAYCLASQSYTRDSRASHPRSGSAGADSGCMPALDVKWIGLFDALHPCRRSALNYNLSAPTFPAAVSPRRLRYIAPRYCASDRRTDNAR